MMRGLLLFAYGAPRSMDELEAYYAHIQNKKNLSEEALERIHEQFYRIGIGDTLGSIALRQASALEHALNSLFHEPIKVYIGCRHTAPFVADAVEQMARDEITDVYTFSLKPIESKQNATLYEKMAEQAAKRAGGIRLIHLRPEDLEPKWIPVMADRIRTAYEWLPAHIREKTEVIFTAHSIAGKPDAQANYRERLEALAERVANAASISKWQSAFRSAGPHGGLWAGPDVKEVMRERAASGAKGIIVFDLQSLTFNVEVAYDIGYDLQELAEELGIHFFRAVQLDDSYDFITAAAAMIQEGIKRHEA